MCFDPKIGYVTYGICRIPCACTLCTSIIDQPWITGFQEQQQYRYQPVKECTYRTVLCSSSNVNILKLSHKATSSEEIDKIHQVVLEGISENMDELVQTDECGAINTTYTTTMGYYVIELISENNLQKE